MYIKEFQVKDGYQSINCQASKFTVNEYRSFVSKIVEILCKTEVDGISEDTIFNIANNFFQTGEAKEIDAKDRANLDKLSKDNSHIFPLIIKMLTKAYATAGDKDRTFLEEILLTHCTVVGREGVSTRLEYKLSFANVDVVLTDWTTLYKIYIEVLKFQFPKLESLQAFIKETNKEELSTSVVPT